MSNNPTPAGSNNSGTDTATLPVPPDFAKIARIQISEDGRYVTVTSQIGGDPMQGPTTLTFDRDEFERQVQEHVFNAV